jgi:L-type amino acid transporter 9
MDAFGPIPAFLFSWVSTLVLKPSQLAIIILTFAQYTCEAFLYCEAPPIAIKLVAIATISKTQIFSFFLKLQQ